MVKAPRQLELVQNVPQRLFLLICRHFQQKIFPSVTWCSSQCYRSIITKLYMHTLPEVASKQLIHAGCNASCHEKWTLRNAKSYRKTSETLHQRSSVAALMHSWFPKKQPHRMCCNTCFICFCVQK